MLIAKRIRLFSTISWATPPDSAKPSASLTVNTDALLSAQHQRGRSLDFGRAHVEQMASRRRFVGLQHGDGQFVTFDGVALDGLTERVGHRGVADDAHGQPLTGGQGVSRPDWRTSGS